jgi:hypothetical protein
MQKILALLLLFGSVALPMVSQADASMTSEQLIEKIAQDQRKIARYKAVHEAATEEDAQLLMLQFLQREQQLRANLSWLVEKVIAGDSDHKDQALAIVMAQSEVISKEILFIDTAVEKATAERGEAETVIATMTADQKINHANVVLDDYLNAFLINSQQLDQLGAATASNIQSKKLDKLLNHYAHKAEGQLALAKMSLDNVSGLLAYAPEESKAELLSKKNVLAHKTRNIAASMSRRIALMDIRGLDTATFHVLLLGTTGQLSGDIFDSKVVRDIVSRAAELLSNWFLHNGVDLIWQLLLFIAILVAFKALSKIAVRVVEAALRKSTLNVSALLRDFFCFDDIESGDGNRRVNCLLATRYSVDTAVGGFGHGRCGDWFCPAGYPVELCLRHDDSTLSPLRCWRFNRGCWRHRFSIKSYLGIDHCPHPR